MSFPSTRSAKWVWSRARAVRPGPSHARDERFNKKIEYIRYNQVRAGLARKPDQWAHVHFHDWVGKEPVGGGPGRTVLPPGCLLQGRVKRVANQNGVASRLCVRKRLPLQRLKAPGYFFRVLA